MADETKPKDSKFVLPDDEGVEKGPTSYEEWVPPWAKSEADELTWVPNADATDVGPRGREDDEDLLGPPTVSKALLSPAEVLAEFFDGEPFSVIEKNDWFSYVPRDKNGNWVSMGGAKSAASEEQHVDAARLHDAKAKFLRDKHPEKVEAAEAHDRAAELHREASELLKAGDPNAATVQAAARKASEDAEKASKGAGKGKYGKKPPKEKDKEPVKEPDKAPEPLKPGAIRPIGKMADLHANNVQAAEVLYGAKCKGWLDPADKRAHGAYASCGWDDKVRISKTMEDQLDTIVARAKAEGGIATVTNQQEAFAVLAYAHENIHATGVKSEPPYGGNGGSSSAEYQTDIGKVFEEGTTEGLSQLRWREQLETMNVRVSEGTPTQLSTSKLVVDALTSNGYFNREVAATHIVAEYVAHGTMDNANWQPGNEGGAFAVQASREKGEPVIRLSTEAKQAMEDMAVRWAPRERTLRAGYAMSLKADERNGAGGKSTSSKPEESLTRLRATALKSVMIMHASNLRSGSFASKGYRETFEEHLGRLCNTKSVKELEAAYTSLGSKAKWSDILSETKTHANTPWLNGMDEYHSGMASRMQSRSQQVKSLKDIPKSTHPKK